VSSEASLNVEGSQLAAQNCHLLLGQPSTSNLLGHYNVTNREQIISVAKKASPRTLNHHSGKIFCSTNS
jgi:hypothetical protein